MTIGRRLLAARLVDEAAIDRALERQRRCGGTLGGNLVAMGAVTAEAVAALLSAPPPAPRRLEDLGLDPLFLMGLVLRLMQGRGLDRPSTLAPAIKLPNGLVRTLLDDARERGHVEVRPAPSAGIAAENIYGLTPRGRSWLAEAGGDCCYVGPAPVSLAAYKDQAGRQRITDDRVDEVTLRRALDGLELPEALVAQLGPAVNSGRAILLHGPAGNGKTSIAEALANCFTQHIWVPHAVMVAGAIIAVHDPAVHHEDAAGSARPGLPRPDERWVRCPRPIVRTAGDLALDMLDLHPGPGGIHHAPLQMKAQGGVMMVDDLGRQRTAAKALLDRLFIPLERGYDVLTLASGHRFCAPFNGLMLLSTNMALQDGLDAAQLRRIPYRYRIEAPTPEAFRRIFQRTCLVHGLEADEASFAALLTEVYQRQGVAPAGYHPGAIVAHVIARCRYAGQSSRLTPELVLEAAGHLHA